MLDEISVAIFSSVEAAYDAAHAIIGLDKAGSIKLISGLIVAKDDRGVVSVLEAKHNPLSGLHTGAVLGGLAGLIGGPPMAVTGALLGASAGAVHDAGMAVLRSQTVSFIKDEMPAGTTAIIFEAREASPNAVDEIVAKGSGSVFRPAARLVDAPDTNQGSP